MKVEMTRNELCRLMMACTGVKWDMIEEHNNPETSDDRKKVLEGSIKMWGDLHDKLKKQLDEYNEKHEN